MKAAKRALDVAVSSVVLAALSPLLAAIAALIWLHDRQTPFYVADRAAMGGGTFRMIKFRSMRVGADRTGVDSTKVSDSRITPIGKILRRYKLDELPQFLNVAAGDMSIVGPRPQVMREVALYTDAERGLLTVRPGITDLSSIVFSDEGEILDGRPDPDVAYHQLIRPWKSRLGLLYAERASVVLDLEIIVLTVVALWSRPVALRGVARILSRLGADANVCGVSLRTAPLVPSIPPGATQVVRYR